MLANSTQLIHHPDETLGPSCVFLPQTLAVPEALLFWWEVLQSPKLPLSCLGKICIESLVLKERHAHQDLWDI